MRDGRAGDWPDVAVEYSWMLRVAGNHEAALQELDGWISATAKRLPPPHHVILERVRALAALERWDEAEEVTVCSAT
jgi:hypothetical protein